MPIETGSRRFFMYTADNGSEYAVELDESIYETAALGFATLPGQRDVISASGRLPLAMRYVNCSRVDANDRTIRAQFFVGSSAAFVALQNAGTVTVDGDAWNLSSVRGEQRKIVPATDTESLDGDTDDNISSGT